MNIAKRRVRALPGRLRIEVQGLRGSPSLAAQLETLLRREPGIQVVSCNVLTGTALVLYEPHVLAEVRWIGIIEAFERERRPQGARPGKGGLALRAVQPALATILAAGTVSGISFLRAPAGAQEGLGTASAALAVAGGYPQVPTFGLDLSTPLDVARTLAYGATDNALGLAASAVSSCGSFAEHLALSRASHAIERLVDRDMPAGARRRFQHMLHEDPGRHGNPLPPAVATYVEIASIPAILGGLFAAALWRSWLAGLAVLAAANPRSAHEGATTADAAALRRAASRRFFVRRRGITARLDAISVLLLDEESWETIGEQTRGALREQLTRRGGAVRRLDRGRPRRVIGTVRGWQRRGLGVAVVAADPALMEPLRAADVSVAVLVPGRVPPPYPADIIVGAADLPYLSEVLLVGHGEAATKRQNQWVAAVLGGGAALLALLGLLPLSTASASYSVTGLLTTLNGQRLAWWPRQAYGNERPPYGAEAHISTEGQIGRRAVAAHASGT